MNARKSMKARSAMNRTRTFRRGLVGLALSGVLLAPAACGEPEQEEPMPDMPMHEGMEMPMQMDPAMMARHAEEAEAMAGQVRGHIDTFRPLTAEEQQDRIAEHTGIVARMLSLMDRQMGEMSMGMPMDHAEMGAMMGMSAEEHRTMMEEMARLRAEAEELQLASREELGARVQQHLDRLEGMAERLEEVARAMREM